MNKIGLDDSLDLTGEFRGIVVNNNDPDKDNRIKVRVPFLHGDISESDLPWAIPAGSSRLGGPADSSNDHGEGGVPYTGSKVYVEFENGDPHDPVWKWDAVDKGQVPKRFRGEQDQAYDDIENNRTGPENATEIPNYPDGRGWVLKNGSVFELSDDGRFLVYTSEGYRLEVKSDGVVVTHVDNDEQHIVVGDKTEYIDGDMDTEKTGDKTETVGGSINIEGTEYGLEAGGVSIDLANGQVEIGGGNMESVLKESIRAVLNSHTHSGVSTGLSISGPPITPIVNQSNITQDTIIS